MRHEPRLCHFGFSLRGRRMSDSDKENGVQYFEGVEKLLEVWFKKSDGDNKSCDLRNIPRQKWEGLLKIVRCEIISFVRNDHVDAYVLRIWELQMRALMHTLAAILHGITTMPFAKIVAESSMFVARRRFILKTCGNTTPLLCLKPLLLLVEQYAGYDEVEDVFYSRKNFKRPELQLAPHHSFEEEVALLDTFFNDGAAYCLGTINRDCWYLYTLNRIHNNQNKLCCGMPKSIDEGLHEPDQTLEILMSDLDQRVMNVFTKEFSSTAAEATQKSGIDKLMPNMVIDDFLFEPCGYSMNGISKNGCYMTIHITPEPEFSYVSFESNVPQSSYKEVIARVLETFQPGKFVLTVFANKTSIAAGTPRELENTVSFGPWMRHEIQYCRFKNYDLTYAFYSKFPS